MPSSPVQLEGPQHGPIAVRPEFITTEETTVRVKELDNSVLTRDFVVTKVDGPLLIQASGKTISNNLRREFTDADGLPLFELRQNRAQKADKAWSLSLPGAEQGDDVLAVAFRMFLVHTKFDVKFRNLAVPSTDHNTVYRDRVTLQVRGQDLSNMSAHVSYEGKKIMHICREADADGQRAAYKHAYGYRTEWEVKVAQGVDLSLAAIIVIVLAEQRG